MGNDKKDSKHVFRFRMSKPGPSAPSTNPTSEPGAGSSQTSVASLEIQQPVVTKGKSWRSRLWNRSRPPSPVPPVTLPGTATPTPTPDLAPPPDVTSVVEPTSGPTPTPNLATTPDVTSVVEPTSEPTPEHQPVASANQTLWQEALEKIAVEDKLGVDLNAGSLLRNLIDSTKERKLEIEKKQWVYKNKDGETVVYADRFLTLLNKYAGIVDIAIQHDPHVVALVWSGFRFLLQVSWYMGYHGRGGMACVFAYSFVLSRSRLRIWRTYAWYSGIWKSYCVSCFVAISMRNSTPANCMLPRSSTHQSSSCMLRF